MKTNHIFKTLPALFLASTTGLYAADEAVKTSEPGLLNNSLFWILFSIIIILLIFIMSVSAIIRNLAEGSKDKAKEIGNKSSSSIIGMSVLFLLFTLNLQAAEPETKPVTDSIFSGFINGLDVRIFWILVMAIVVEAFALLFMIGILRSMLKTLGYLKEPTPEESMLSMKKWNDMLTDAVPVEREAEIMTDHEYDGIKELDNNLPPWWKYGFYVTIISAVIYIINFHFTRTGDQQSAEYQKELVAAELAKQEYLKIAGAKVDENTVTALTDAGLLAEGKTIFVEKCAACHGKGGEGNVGPNLTDAYWLHGGSIKDIFKTVKYGVPSKGMIAWESQLKPNEIQTVASYILTLAGTNPPNAKAPQGELYAPDASAADSTAAMADSTAVIDTTKVSAPVK